MGDDSFAIADILDAIADRADLLRTPLKSAASSIRDRSQQFVTELTEDVGNYTPEFAKQFQAFVGDDPPVERLDPTWSGQNHHFARADLAVRLLLRLIQLMPQDHERILLWGHSHAGNGFALLTNLLANDPQSVQKFFAAPGEHEELPQHWKFVRQFLRDHSGVIPFARNVDIVAFGTPVRYGWDTSGCGQLVHIHHHVVDNEDEPYRARPVFPLQSLPDIFSAKYGDWVQLFGIADTDVAPPTAGRQQLAFTELFEGSLSEPDHAVGTMLIPDPRLRNLCARWKTGTRCHADGKNLLLTYEPCGRRNNLAIPIESSLFGHGVATVLDWLPQHLAMVIESLAPPK